jgi:hypothetical protein
VVAQEVTMVASALSLESRIAAMLSAADAKSDAIAALITEVEVAAQEADATATKTREEALDPTIVVDTAKVGAAVATAELTRDRLQVALPRLQEQLKQAREREYAECWLNDYAAVKVRRDAAAEQLRERYPTIVAELVALTADIAAADREVDRVNAAAPYGDYPRLRSVELRARGLDRLLQPDISIVQELRLPNFTRADNEPVLAYPPPVPNLALQALSMMPPDNFDWRNWHEECEKRDRRALQENRRRVRVARTMPIRTGARGLEQSR